MAPRGSENKQRRLLLLDGILRADAPNSLEKLAERLGVTVRTVCRDLDHMKEVLHLPVHHQRGHGYRYAGWVPPFESPAPFPSKPLEPSRPLPPESLRRLLETLHNALVERRAVDLERFGGPEREPFHPHFLSRFRGEWTLFGWTPGGLHPASYPLSSLREVRLRSESFVLSAAEPAVRSRGGWVPPGRTFGVGICFASRLPWAMDLRICEEQVEEVQAGWTAYRFRTDDLESLRRLLALCPRGGISVEEPSFFRSLLREHLLGACPPTGRFPTFPSPGTGKGP